MREEGRRGEEKRVGGRRKKERGTKEGRKGGRERERKEGR